MQNQSMNYPTILADPTHKFRVSLVISDPDGSNPVTYSASKMYSLRTDSKVYDQIPTIGGCYSATCEFSLLDDGSTIPRMARCEIKWQASDGVNTSNTLSKGVFYIDTREVHTDVGGISVFNAFCYDAMMFANQTFSPGSYRWPATDTTVISRICTILGITEDSRNSYYINLGHSIPAPTGKESIRDYLSYIGVMYGGNWIITDNNELRFIPLGYNVPVIPGYNHDYRVFPNDITSIERGAGQPYYDAIKIQVSDNEYITSGNGSENRVLEAYCPFMTQAIADAVYLKVSNQPFAPFDCSLFVDPTVELNDLLIYSLDPDDPSGTEQFHDRIVSRVIDFGQLMSAQLSSPNEQEVDHENIYVTKAETEFDELAETTADMYDTMSDGLRNLIVNTKVPSVTDLPSLYGQLGVTYFQNYTPTPAEHGIRLTKGTSSSSSVLFAFGETSNTSLFASMCGLEAGETYTLSFDWAYTLFAASSDETYMRWRLLSWDSTSSGATLTRTEFMREPITRNTATSKPGVKGTFVVPEDAVVLCVYMDFVTSSGGVDTVIPNSAVRSTDYYEFANFKMQKGVNATEWTAAPEDDDTLEGVTTFIDSSGIDSAQINTTGLVFFDTSGNTTASYNASRTDNIVTKAGTSVTLASATSGMTNLTSFKLTPGLWIVCCVARFASNSTGYRTALISTTSTGTTAIDNTANVGCAAANGIITRLPLVTAINVASSTTYYLNARQNSGSSLASYGYVYAVKVS